MFNPNLVLDMPPRIEIAATDIVVVGSIDLTNFSAEWLREQGIVRPSESDPTAVEETRTDTTYNLKGGAFQLSANASRLTVQSSLGNAPVVKDLMIGLLMLDKAKTVRAIGMNFHGHYKCTSEAQWHAIGDKLVPKDLWKEVFPEFRPGMHTVQVRMDAKNNNDRVEVTVQPSARFAQGVFMFWNDHNTAPSPDGSGSDWAVDVIKKRYDELRIESFSKFEEILSKCTA